MSTCLRLQFLLPTQHVTLFDVFFIIELILLPINIVVMAIAMRVVNKIRAHTNLLQIINSFILNYLVCCFCRIIIVIYQMRIFTFEGEAQDNVIIMFCSFVRTYFFSTILTGISVVFVERLAATFFMADYEKKKRLYIPLCLITYNFFVSVGAAGFFTYEILPWWFLAGIGVMSSLFGALLLKTSFLLLSLQNVPYAAVYTVGNMSMIRELEDGWISQLLETLFNFLVATDGVIIALVVFLTDPTYVLAVKNLKYIGWLTPTFHVNLEEVMSIEPKNESNIYFMNMTTQWNIHLREVEEAREKKSQGRRRSRRSTVQTENGD